MSADSPDIDELPAVAVLMVIFEHYALPFFPGDYVGVDVLVVISGYLITMGALRTCSLSLEQIIFEMPHI